jgi:hypothetical protein
VISNANGGAEDVEEGGDLAEDGSRTATLRLIPEDSNSCKFLFGKGMIFVRFLVNLITSLMQQCHLMNPDEDDQQGVMEYSFDDDVAESSEPVEADDSWFTGETPDNEIRLSDEGRSNLERIVGNLNLGKSSSFYSNPPKNKPGEVIAHTTSS